MRNWLRTNDGFALFCQILLCLGWAYLLFWNPWNWDIRTWGTLMFGGPAALVAVILVIGVFWSKWYDARLRKKWLDQEFNVQSAPGPSSAPAREPDGAPR